jgi:GT2 family glycosyltransferase
MARGTAIVVTYNSSLWVERCLEALLSQPGWEVVVIDNASQDDTPARAARFASQARVVCNTDNKGFAGGVNQGVRLASTDLLVLINPDAIAAPGALDKLADALTTYQADAVGGMLLLEGGRPQIGNMVRRLPTLGSVMAELLLLNNVWYRNPWNRSYRCLDLDYTRPQPVECPAGASLMFRRDVWESVGGFDEAFHPAWFEDADFCCCLLKAGWKIMYEPAAVFDHGANHSGKQLSFYKHQVFWYGNLLRYFRKHFSRFQCSILRGGITAGMLLRALLSLLMPPPVGRKEALSAYVRCAWKCGIRPPKASRTSPPPMAAPTRVGAGDTRAA